MTTIEEQVLTVADRLLKPEAVLNAVGRADAASLTRGLAGTALLHARLAHIDPRFARAAQQHWTAAAAHLKNHRHGFSGIAGGQGGLAASLIIGTGYLPEGNRHHAAAAGASWLAVCARDAADLYQRTDLLTWDVYDAITGLSGIGRVLLAAQSSGYDDVESGLMAALTALTAILEPRDTGRPGWWMPAENHPNLARIHPSGAATTGLAHGVAGPLALLATAHVAGWSVPGQAEGIDHAADWLLDWRRDDGTWPPSVTGDELDTAQPPSTPGRADAWCYGTPGISRSLHLAGLALDDPHLQAAAISAVDTMGSRKPAEWDVEGPTLCHGYAGFLQSAPDNHPVAGAVVEAISAYFDSSHRFGFQHRDQGQTHVEPGLLTGAAGVALALAEHQDLPTPGTPASWECLLNLS
ncbi:lanthionine synthetase C family protein [Stackebrandtia nassauensis]|uniref:Lanthionine synthetase C family protein n=1 Tax=Stackebrandtia nassauensis (strain DSM 44728 / CIP 108903 / NRRL B-16338 / NBRC 102104 / LLR-40K-21) TaxID=446470 RepID=D3PVS9_STANL|nr:lanthionine synthetase C family protein [Stackebrandtia nassauensis]ADD45050.1 Lanthionine synthetase C family protein [Stackebrandtia nassauensis DSM 44728]